MDEMNRTLAYEARMLGRKLERKAQRLEEAAKRKLESQEVIVADYDDIRGDIVSLIKNAKPENVSLYVWLHELEARGGVKAKTMARWIDGDVKTPQTRSMYDTLHALGLAYYIGRAR